VAHAFDTSRRGFLAGVASALQLRAEGKKGETFPSDSARYTDATTENDGYRLTKPDYSTAMPAYYSRMIAHNSSWMLVCCDRSGSPQAFHLDLKTAQMKQLTEIADLDGASLTLTPDNRSFCFFAGRSLFHSNVATLHEREVYKIPEGWERCPGMSVGPDGTHAILAERKGDTSRLRMIPLLAGAVRTVMEAPFAISDPMARPMRAQILYRQGADALWLVNQDGQQNRKLKTATGSIGQANWSDDGKTVFYLNIPQDPKELRAIRELSPDANTDKLVAKTSQYASFGFNRDASVFAGASKNAGSPTVLLLLRITRRERTLGDHRAANPETVDPVFSPDSQRLYFQSDREGKSAIYGFHLDKLVEKTAADISQ
jgi:oligogalacturonide lyase